MTPIENLTAVARRAADLGDPMFVGGAILPLLILSPSASAPRYTEDVDVVANVSGYGALQKLEEHLRGIGWVNDQHVICRWHTPDGVIVDVVPNRPDILGFSNRWYESAEKLATRYELPTGERIRLIHPAMFVATKLEAFSDRGNGDVYSYDLEDAIVVIDARPDFERELAEAPVEACVFITGELKRLLNQQAFQQALPNLIGFDAAAVGRAELLAVRLSAMVDAAY